MRKIWLLGALAFLGLSPFLTAAPQFGRDRSRGSDEVCIYRDIHYQGAEQCFRLGDSISTLQGLNGQPSSIRIYGGASVTVYDATNFRGHSTVFTSSVPDLGQVRLESKSWNDRIQSLQVDSGKGSNGPYGNPPVYSGRYPNDDRRYPNDDRQYPTNQLSEGICVYDRPNYNGRSQCWSPPEGESLGDLGSWGDRISSIRTFGGTRAVVYRDIGFRGASFVVNGDIPDLARVQGQGMRSWDHQISSIQIDDERGNGRGRGRGRGRNRD
jgi:Peptidase inhibitor family I36